MAKSESVNHTPGPWRQDGFAVRIPKYPCLVVFDSEADARLTAAAPDMLAAMHPLMMSASAQVDWWKQEALRLRNIGANDSSAQEIADRWFKLFKDADAAIAKATGPQS